MLGVGFSVYLLLSIQIQIHSTDLLGCGIKSCHWSRVRWHSSSCIVVEGTMTRFYAVPLQAGRRHHDIRITQFRSLSGSQSSNWIYWETKFCWLIVVTTRLHYSLVSSLASCLVVGWLLRRHTGLFFLFLMTLRTGGIWIHHHRTQFRCTTEIVKCFGSWDDKDIGNAIQSATILFWLESTVVRHHGSWFKTILRL